MFCLVGGGLGTETKLVIDCMVSWPHLVPEDTE